MSYTYIKFKINILNYLNITCMLLNTEFLQLNNVLNLENIQYIPKFKKGNKIRIKKENRGKFTEYCGGNVTQECIRRGKNSPNPVIRKRATFADNARHWKKK